jgi:WD40 repeat protein
MRAAPFAALVSVFLPVSALADSARKDIYGDPLPRGALARIGSSRLRMADLDKLFFSAEGKELVGWSRAYSKLVFQVWDFRSGKGLRRIEPKVTFSQLPSVSPVVTQQGQIILVLQEILNPSKPIVHTFDLRTGKELERREFTRPAMTSFLNLSPDGKRIALIGSDKSLRIHETNSGAESLRLRIPSDSIRLSWNAQGTRIAIMIDHTVSIHDARTGERIAEFHGEKGTPITNVDISSDGRHLVSLQFEPGKEGPLILWDVTTGKKLYRETSRAWLDAAFSPDSKQLLLCSYETDPRLLDLTTSKVVRSFAAPWVRSVAFSPDGTTLAIGHLTSITLWEVATGRPLPGSGEPKLEIYSLRFSADGKRLFGTAENVIAWDPATGKELRRFPNPPHNRGRFVTLSPDESLVAGSSLVDNKLRLCEATTGKQLLALEPDVPVLETLFTPDSRRLITSAQDGIRVWDVKTGQVLHRLTRKRVVPRAISPDGTWLACGTGEALGSGKGSLRLWNLNTGVEATELPVPGEWVRSVAFSHDGRWLAARVAADRAGTSDILWALPTRKLMRKWDSAIKPGFPLAWSSVAFSPDDRTVVFGGDDGVLRLREVVSGNERHQIRGHEGRIGEVVFSPDGKWLAASSDEAPVYVWDFWAGLPAGKKLSPEDLDRCWKDLAGDDAAAAFRAIRSLSTLPEKAVPFLRERLKRVPPPDRKLVQRLIAGLDSKNFNERQKATAELERLGDVMAPLLEEALPKAGSLETRQRLAKLLARLQQGTAEGTRIIRAVEALAWTRTPEAVRLLEDLAQGATAALLTREAIKARDRLRPGRKSARVMENVERER